VYRWIFEAAFQLAFALTADPIAPSAEKSTKTVPNQYVVLALVVSGYK
jgi:hypothetical protein